MIIRPGDGTGSLEKAIDVLEAIGSQHGGISHHDLAERLGMPRTTVYRLLATLVMRGLARHDPARRVYYLGTRCFELSRQALAMPDLVTAATQELQDLRDLTGETSYIGTLEGMAVVSLERYDSPHSDRSNVELGHRKPVYATSQGKAILAALNTSLREDLITALTLAPRTPLTITDRRRLRAEIQTIQTRGWSIDNEENVPGVRCVGAAIVDAHGTVRGAISVAGPAYRLPLSRLDLLGPELVAAARRIGARLQSDSSSDEKAEIKATSAAPSLFGACPLWQADQGRLLWVDTLAPALRGWKDGADQPIVRVDRSIKGMFFRDTTVCLVHDEGGIEIYPDGKQRPLSAWRPMEILAVDCHPTSEPWVALPAPKGSVIGPIGKDGGFRRKWSIDEAVDSLRWSADGKLLYAAAPASGTILQLQPGTETVRRLATVPQGSGTISGLALDSQGGLWTSLRDGWSVVRFREDGSLDRSIPLPVPYPTGIAVGGPALDRLYVTTARQPVALETLRAAPLSGRLFEIALSPASVEPA